MVGLLPLNLRWMDDMEELLKYKPAYFWWQFAGFVPSDL
jgi:hypothetical protein